MFMQGMNIYFSYYFRKNRHVNETSLQNGYLDNLKVMKVTNSKL